MKKIFIFKSGWQFVESIVFIALGIITMVFSRNQDYWKVIGYVTGVLLALDGAFRLLVYFVSNNIDTAKMSLIVCVSEVTLSVFVFICAEIVVYYFALLVAILLVVLGFVTFADALSKSIKKSEKPILIIGEYIFAAILLSLGIVALCFYPYESYSSGSMNTISVMMFICGIVLILGGIAETVYTFICISKIKKQALKQNEEIAHQREEKRSKSK